MTKYICPLCDAGDPTSVIQECDCPRRCTTCNATRHTTEECRERRLMDHQLKRVKRLREIAEAWGLDLSVMDEWNPNK